MLLLQRPPGTGAGHAHSKHFAPAAPQVLSLDGTLQFTFGSLGRGAGGFLLPVSTHPPRSGQREGDPAWLGGWQGNPAQGEGVPARLADTTTRRRAAALNSAHRPRLPASCTPPPARRRPRCSWAWPPGRLGYTCNPACPPPARCRQRCSWAWPPGRLKCAPPPNASLPPAAACGADGPGHRAEWGVHAPRLPASLHLKPKPTVQLGLATGPSGIHVQPRLPASLNLNPKPPVQLGLATGPTGVVVTDYFDHSVQKFDFSGGFLWAIGGQGQQDGKASWAPRGRVAPREGLPGRDPPWE